MDMFQYDIENNRRHCLESLKAWPHKIIKDTKAIRW